MRKTLVYHHALIKSLKQKYQSAREEKTRQLISRIVIGKILKKYQLQKTILETVGVTSKRFRRSLPLPVEEPTCFARKKYSSTQFKLHDSVVKFYTRDDVSHSTAGKKRMLKRN